MKTDKEKLEELLLDFGIPSTVFTDKQCIADEAVKKKAIESICLMDVLDIAFDKNGKALGFYTSSRTSWKKRQK